MEQKIIDGNVKIAQFDGLTKDTYGKFFKNGVFKGYNETEFQYHKSWDWLMAVVKKCREESNDEDSYWEAIYYSLVDLDIDSVYNAVIKFITWYNETKQK